MILVKPNVEKIDQQDFSLAGIYKQIEKCTRVSYKSEDRITENSAEDFVKMLIERGHLAGLEFGVVQLLVDIVNPNFRVYNFVNKYTKETKLCTIFEFFEQNLYSKIVFNKEVDRYVYVSTNYRVMVEWEMDGRPMEDWMRYNLFLCGKITEKPCFKITTSRDIADEMRTHRAFSWVMESSRFCNYSKDKFDNNVRFVPTSHFDMPDNCYNTQLHNYSEIENSIADPKAFTFELESCNFELYTYLSALLDSETGYKTLIANGTKPDIARKVLSFSFKTDLCMCGFMEDYEHFLELRTDKHAHIDMQLIANKIKDLLQEKSQKS